MFDLPMSHSVCHDHAETELSSSHLYVSLGQSLNLHWSLSGNISCVGAQDCVDHPSHHCTVGTVLTVLTNIFATLPNICLHIVHQSSLPMRKEKGFYQLYRFCLCSDFLYHCIVFSNHFVPLTPRSHVARESYNFQGWFFFFFEEPEFSPGAKELYLPSHSMFPQILRIS